MCVIKSFSVNKKYIDIPLLRGANSNENLIENNCGEIKFQLLILLCPKMLSGK